MSYENPDDAPRANSTQWYKCESCENLHIILLDENNESIATAVFDEDMLNRMLSTVKGIAQ